jgi:transcription elongation GreA/GreB family factor
MSRAFVKEDAAAPPPPFERPVSGALVLVTPRGARLIEAEIARLEAEVAGAADDAAADPLRRDLRYWTTRRATAQRVQAEAMPEEVGFGCRVSIRRQATVSTLEIVGEDEADSDHGRVSWTSPLACALEGAVPGETVQFHAGGRIAPVEVQAAGPGSG